MTETHTAPGARFCSQCGQPIETMKSPSGRLPWVISGGALAVSLALLLTMLVRSAPAVGTSPTQLVESAAASPPDISNMSPRERFDRLYNRVMQAAQAGDETTVTRFTPMALQAYIQLDSVDADARYHAALLEVHSGDVAGPLALSDTILVRQPGHLFGYVIRGTVARWRKDQKALTRAYAGFLSHYDAEIAARRPEYADHQASLNDFHQQAEKARSRAPGT